MVSALKPGIMNHSVEDKYLLYEGFTISGISKQMRDSLGSKIFITGNSVYPGSSFRVHLDFNARTLVT